MVYVTTIQSGTTVPAPVFTGKVDGDYCLAGLPVLGSNVDANFFTINNLRTPTADSDVATKEYVDRSSGDISRVTTGILDSAHGGTHSNLSSATGIMCMTNGVASAVSRIDVDAVRLHNGPYECSISWSGGNRDQTISIPETNESSDTLVVCNASQSLVNKTLIDSTVHTFLTVNADLRAYVAGWYMVPCDCQNGQCAVTLPPAAKNRAVFTFFTDRGNNAIRLVPTSPDTISGTSKLTTANRRACVTVFSNQTDNWVVMSQQ